MQVSFQGINNLSIVNTKYKTDGLYKAINGQVKHGNMNYSSYNLKCRLTNDTDGDDLQYFHDQLAKCRMCYQVNCLDMKNPDIVDIAMVKRSAADSKEDNFIFSIRDYVIMLDEFQVLRLVDFIAKITKKISQKSDISKKDRLIAQFMNESIAQKAKSFIEKGENGHLN